jgi:hypothetical protein
VMDGFRRQQVAAEDLFHDDYVFEYILPLSRARVTWGPEHDIPGLMPSAPSPPAAVRRACHTPAVGAGS